MVRPRRGAKDEYYNQNRIDLVKAMKYSVITQTQIRFLIKNQQFPFVSPSQNHCHDYGNIS